MPKSSRGQILDWLNKIYPNDASEMTIISVFYEYFTDNEIRRDLQFMVDKKYLSCKQVRHPVKRSKIENHYRITAYGIELLEGTKSDPSIILESDHNPEDAE